MKTEYCYNPELTFIRDDIKGNLKIDGEFVFKDKKDKLPYQHLLRWIVTRNPQYSEKKADNYVPNVVQNTTFNFTDADKIVWLGHSSFYIQLDNVRLLTDPVFYHPSPVGLRRRHAMPCSVSQLNNIDIVLLSHGHRDHLDLSSLKEICKYNTQSIAVCPMGFKPLLKKCGFNKVIEMAWWQEFNFKDMDLVFLPAKHWNRRFIHDYNKELWGSFSISTEKKSIYFAGDTGYDKHFIEIQQYFPKFDYCIMPIGAYKPRYVMKWAHTAPDEAVAACNELNGKYFIPMHYGTFDLSDEPAGEPLMLLKKYKEEMILKAHLLIPTVGGELLI